MNTLIIEQCYSLCEWECVPTLSDTVDSAKEPYWNGNTQPWYSYIPRKTKETAQCILGRSVELTGSL